MSAEPVELDAENLPAVCPHAGMPLWASHPRVFLDVVNEREAMCPYCGTRYRLRGGTRVHDHQFGARCLHQHERRGAESESAGARAARSSIGKDVDSPVPSADAFRNTTLELITRWLTGGRAR